MIAIPFISHVEKQITPEDAQKIAEILGLPPELTFLNLSIDENLNLRAFARGISQDMPFSYNSVPMNWLSYQPKPQALSDPLVIVPDKLPTMSDTQPIDSDETLVNPRIEG